MAADAVGKWMAWPRRWIAVNGSLVWPAAVFIAVNMAIVAALAFVAAHTQDAFAIRSAVERLEAAVAAEQRNLGRLVRDYAWWDDAFQRLAGARLDLAWAEANIGSYLAETFGVTETLAVDGDDRIIVAFRDGAQVPERIGTAAPEPLAALARRTREASTDAPAPTVGFARVDSRPLLVAAAAILPEAAEAVRATPRPGAVLLFMRAVDAGYLQRIAEDYLFPGLSLHATPDGAPATLPVLDGGGATLAHLGWPVHRPGAALARELVPAIGLAFVVSVGFAIGYLRQRRSTEASMAQTAQLLRDKDAALSAFAERVESFADAAEAWFFDVDGRLRIRAVLAGPDAGAPPLQPGGSLSSMVDREGRPVLPHLLNAITQRAPVRKVAVQIPGSAGRPRGWSLSAVPQIDGDGGFEGFRCTLSPLPEGSDLAREIVDSFTDGIAVFDASDKLIHCNRVFRDLHRDTGGDLAPGLPVDELFRRMARSGQFHVRGGHVESWVAEQFDAFARGAPVERVVTPSGRMVAVMHYKTRGGGTVRVETPVR